jgi:hypothetical protein
MNYKEMLEIVSKVWINSNDIMKLCNCGKNTANKIRQDVEKIVIDNGKVIPPSVVKYVPTKLVLEYIGLDEDYIFKMASRIS